MKYKVGDQVRIVTKWKKDVHSSTRENKMGRMDKYMGTVMTIWDIETNDYGFDFYRMKEDNGCWEWFGHMIEGKEDKIMFGKSDLVNGDILVMRSGERYVVMKDYCDGRDSWISVSESGWLDPHGFSEDMRCGTMGCFDVIRVLRPIGRYVNFVQFCESDYNVVYERDESRKKMTVEDIERELGYKVAIVDKDGVKNG